MSDDSKFTFAISLSVLNHLGRNLYRSFATVLGEAISNSWDADANNVWIFIDRKKSQLVIKDDGAGMTAADFQNRFLKIGYSKRKEGGSKSSSGRPYIGRKGIGKLALLSCAKKITVISKVESGEYIGGVIDNSELDKAIEDELTPSDYPLEDWSDQKFKKYIKDHDHGTIIFFEGIHGGINNTVEYIKTILALYFQFSLIDENFNLHLNGDQIDYASLGKLAEKTEFLWTINNYSDPYIVSLKSGFGQKNEYKNFKGLVGVKGFIASVEKPRNLKIFSTEERASIDLFVNGRLRERDLLKHIPTSRVAENYLYGQIHFNGLDDVNDRFTSSREGIVADDPKFEAFLEKFRKEIILRVVEDWDDWRIKHRKTGDPENEDVPTKQRKSRELYNVVAGEYELEEGSENKAKVEGWVNDLADDAEFNFFSYAECFISENLLRRFAEEEKVNLSKEANKVIAQWKKQELQSKNKGNISIDIRESASGLLYLSMTDLANWLDKKDPNKEACLARDAYEYKPMRDAVAHTALLSEPAKNKLSSVYENIKARVRNLLDGEDL